MRRLPSVIAAAAALTLAACGGSDPERRDSVPAAGPNTPSAATPGVPAGAPYDVDGTEWLELSQVDQFVAAKAYIDDNPDRCNEDPPVKTADVAFYVTVSYGTDFPFDIAASEVLAEGCDAARQS